LFFALWPDDSVRAALAALTRELRPQCGGRAVRASNLHLTLAFLGDVPLSRIPELTMLASELSFAPCTLELSACGYWRHNRVVWAGTAQTPGTLVDLASRLAQSLRVRGYRYEKREYVAHVTLLRDARRAPQSDSVTPIRWPLNEFVLVQSVRGDGGMVYERVACWPAGRMPLR
jgi:RNA 2',3'-cyclic 3'-phosphodiesterase